MTGLLVALAGANLIYGSGMTESGVTFDYGQLVMDDEFARMIKFAVAGIPVDDELLMVDDIHRVGAFGDFLSLDSTYKYMRSQSQPVLIDRRVREDWEAAGATDLYARCSARAREIIETHHPEPVDEAAAKEIRAIVRRADEAAGVA
jgi:trimethylamine--corrinoid protein Co-methyltransferase